MKPTLSPADQQVLEALQQAVNTELERKRSLGHYYVTWQNGQSVLHGADAPQLPAIDSQPTDQAQVT